MRPVSRVQTLRGLGSDDGVESAPPESGSRIVCRPPAIAFSHPTSVRYSLVTPRRKTLAMPLPGRDEVAARRRETVIMPTCVEELERATLAS